MAGLEREERQCDRVLAGAVERVRGVLLGDAESVLRFAACRVLDDGDLATAISPCLVVRHRAQSRSEFAEIGPAVFAREGTHDIVQPEIVAALMAVGAALVGAHRIRSVDDERILTARFAYPAHTSSRVGEGWDEIVGSVCVVAVAAAAFRAACNWAGSSSPRLSARRRIPEQALGLKKYRCGTLPVIKTSDNEHAPAPLGNSVILSVKNSVGDPIPAFPQPSEKGTKIPSPVRRQEAGDVLENHPTGPKSSNKRKGDERQVATRVIQSEPPSRDREGLAG